MAKVKQPLLSLDARRKLGDDIVFKRQGRTAIVETRPHPPDTRSVGQLSWRHMFQKVVALWHALSAVEKEAWESLGRKRHMTGYAWFVSQALRPNPGIYLPLQGGTMAGDIDMAKNRLLKLPTPTDVQEAVPRGTLISQIAAHTAIAAAHHARYADAEAQAVADAQIAIHAALITGVHGAGDSILATTFNIATHAAIAAAHHARYTDGEAVTAAKTVKLDDFATPDDNADLNASAARHGLLRKLGGGVVNFLRADGTWAEPPGVGGAVASSGTYVGGGGANQAVPHGLGVVPKIVFLTLPTHDDQYTGWCLFSIQRTWDGTMVTAVTAPTTTNFYVSTNFVWSGHTYRFVALS